MRARDCKADLGRRDQRDVGEVRSARVGVVEDPHVAGLWRPLQHGGNRVRHRAEVHGNVLGLRDHPSALVEDRRRAVAALLDVRRERRAHERSAHLLRDRPQERADDLQLDVHHGSRSVRRSRIKVPWRSVSPDQPGGTQAVAPGSATTCGPSTAR